MSVAARDVLVVFSDAASGCLSRCLKPGFRHCFLLLRLSDSWLLFDPRADRTVFAEWRPVAAARLAEALRAQGYRVLSGRLASEGGGAKRRPFLSCTSPGCVPAVAQALGLDRRGGRTPYGLFLFLRDKKKFLDTESELG